MSDRGGKQSSGRGRGNYRGGSGRGGGEGRGRGRGGGRGGRGRGGANNTSANAPTPKIILDMGNLLDKEIKVKFNGGREISGILKGWDPLLNLVLDETVEYLNGAQVGDKQRKTGLIVCRGPTVLMICPMDGTEEIANPFVQADE